MSTVVLFVIIMVAMGRIVYAEFFKSNDTCKCSCKCPSKNKS